METLRDRFWIFTCVAGSDNDSLEKGGFPNGSRMTPAEGAFYLDVPNLLMIRWRGLPAPPFDQYALSFTPLKRVVWSIVGSGGHIEGDEVELVLDLAHRFPNLTGVIMDDFFNKDGSGQASVDELGKVRRRLEVNGKRLDLWVVLYTHQLDLPVASHLEQCDLISFWTWSADELKHLEQNLERLEALSLGRRISLGCYLWDFYNQRPVPIPPMEHQCSLGRKWLQEGRIENMVFLANTVCDLGLEVVEWTRNWIQQVGDTPLEGS